MPRLLLILIATFSLSACASLERLAIPSSHLKNVELRQTGVQENINHGFWNVFLSRYTTKDNQDVVLVKYADVTTQDHQYLKQYIQTLTKLDSTQLSRNAQLAYWANLYNAQTIDVILDHYPVDSIRQIKDNFFDLGPWENKRLAIHGTPTSLHDIEHGVIRPLWPETPEIHYLVNCAAIGCPNLAQTAYTAENIEKIMEKAAIAYVNNPRGITINDNGRVTASKIYSWYIDDFGGSEASILDHLRLYAAPKLKAELENKTSIDRYIYDWSLNDSESR